VRVPDEAGEGVATVTLTFDDWKKMKPVTLQVAVEKSGSNGPK
jgi:hypothetical protein